MHHHGGGYSDVKCTSIDWNAAFDKMDNDVGEHIMLMGVKTTFGHTYSGIEEWSPTMKDDILQNMNRMACMGWFICRANSRLTQEWYIELNKRLYDYLPRLMVNPSKFTRECFDPELGYALHRPKWEKITDQTKTNYPISWNILLSQILYPLQLKYIHNVDTSTMIHKL